MYRYTGHVVCICVKYRFQNLFYTYGGTEEGDPEESRVLVAAKLDPLASALGYCVARCVW